MNWGWLVVLEVQRSETCLVLEARVGSAAVGPITQDAVFFSSTDRNRDIVAWRAHFRTDCDLSILRQRFGYGHLKKIYIYLFHKQRSRVSREAGRERGGSRLPPKQRARFGAQSQDPGIMT